jgi:branched-chain amino acid transport system ATP-binding protein|tara:strand:+ start:110 stop:811 length:702 start_codon:yes stop_codon:yes gene_type:complete
MSESILNINKIKKTFGGFTAVKDVDLKVSKGEIRFIIGPNGAGKSTLFKLIIGYLKPDYGDVIFKDEYLNKLELHQRIKKGIGLKFQAPSIFNEMTVLQNLEIAANETNLEKYNDFIKLFGIFEEKNSLGGDLSHGKKQWLDIALASISNPDLVLLDEPTAGLSFEETKKTGEIIKYLNKQGTTFLIVEHDMEILKQIATAVSVLHLGALFVEGTPESVLKNKDVAKIYLGAS